VIPIIEDARHPLKYRMLVPMCDCVFADVAQPDQARIVGLNASYYLKTGGHFVISIKVGRLGRKKRKKENDTTGSRTARRRAAWGGTGRGRGGARPRGRVCAAGLARDAGGVRVVGPGEGRRLGSLLSRHTRHLGSHARPPS
jgi:hypothetical protein